MSNHSNPEIQKHIQSSEELVKKMAHLTDILLQENNTNFITITGLELPSAVEANRPSFPVISILVAQGMIESVGVGFKHNK